MNIQDIVYETTGIEGGPIELPGVKIECPKCEEFYDASKWDAYDTNCESCGGILS
jgi:Zn finger protein HypA/HybF involved in hydrogenase expression